MGASSELFIKMQDELLQNEHYKNLLMIEKEIYETRGSKNTGVPGHDMLK